MLKNTLKAANSGLFFYWLKKSVYFFRLSVYIINLQIFMLIFGVGYED